MTKTRAKISGIQGYAPPYILTNKELEGMVDTTDEWIISRTGIKDDHYAALLVDKKRWFKS